jgi:hypothetical protein
MNERIKELAIQAGGYVSLAYEHDGKLILSGEDIVQKFAELIVKECAKVCLNPNHWHEDAAGETYNRAIKEHFGVEL